MIYSIDEKVCEQQGLTLQEALILVLVKSGANFDTLLESMKNKMLIVNGDTHMSYLVTQNSSDKIDSVLLDSDKNKQPAQRIDILATKLMDLFPKRKKEGSSQYFRGNKKDITLRLKKFFKLYGNEFTDEQIIDAAKKYVESFNGDYKYMRVLKYFIWKDEIKVNSDGYRYVDEVSDLATFIENVGSDTSTNRDWTLTLR